MHTGYLFNRSGKGLYEGPIKVPQAKYILYLYKEEYEDKRLTSRYATDKYSSALTDVMLTNIGSLGPKTNSV